MSGSSEAWYRARFGTGRSRVQIPPSRPLTFKGPLVATTGPTTLHVTRLDARRNVDNTLEERSIQEYRGVVDLGRVLCPDGVAQSLAVSRSRQRAHRRARVTEFVSQNEHPVLNRRLANRLHQARATNDGHDPSATRFRAPRRPLHDARAVHCEQHFGRAESSHREGVE